MFKAIAQQNYGGCMMIVKKRDGQGVCFVGTGFLCHAQGYILTCAHTISLTDKLAVIPPQPIEDFNQATLGRVNVLDVSVAQFDSKNDVALLKLTNAQEVSVPKKMFCNKDNAQVGATVCYMGFPYGHSGLHTAKFSQSIISAKVESDSGTRKYQLDTIVHEGNSGGPLIEYGSGKIIGIISGRFNPIGNSGVNITVGGHSLGTESSISYATAIGYGIELLKNEVADV